MNLKNSVTLIGRLTNDVSTSKTANGILYSNFSIAVDRPYRKDKEKEVDFINCTAWGKTAEFISRHFKKGEPIMIHGELRQHNYTNKDGIKIFTFVVNIDSVDFALTVVKDKSNDKGASEPIESENDNNFFAEFEEMYAEGDTPF